MDNLFIIKIKHIPYLKTHLAKQQIIGSICHEKIVFEENQYRTSRLNDVIDWIYTKGNGSGRSKTRLAPIFGSQSNQVPRTVAFFAYSTALYNT